MNRFIGTLPILLLLTLASTSTNACTGVFAYDDTRALFGNNEDYSDPITYIWTLSAAGAHDRVCLGFGNFFAQGCINERGLCYDGESSPKLVETITAPVGCDHAAIS